MTEPNAKSVEVVAAQELLRRLTIEAPELLRAAGEVDVSLLQRAAKLSPLERVDAVSRHLAELRSFRPR